MIGVHEFDQSEPPEAPLKSWRSKFEMNNLTTGDLMKFFQISAPQYFSIDQTAEYAELGRANFDEQGAKCGIIDLLESFICGDNPQNLFEKLKTEENSSSVCGRVFKSGEPTYSCRECGMDPTCVLCVSCFKQSAHRHHKYKMATSGGGGCCDCGDVEAWKHDPYCDEHVLGIEKKVESLLLTDAIRQRCYIVFDVIMNFSVWSLELESNASLTCIGSSDDDDMTYCTVLYNDETHTFEQVIQTLTRIVGCNQKDAIEYVSSIDREGRAVVKCGSFESCSKLKNDIEKQAIRSATIGTKSTALKVSVLHKVAVAYQHFSLQLLAWFQDFLAKHLVFRKIFCEIATRNTAYNINHILTNDWRLWKTARTSWHRLLISGMLMEYENKKILAIIFAKLYPTLMQDFIRDDHEHSFSVVSLSVQLFTVPTIAQHLIAYECAFFKLMHTFYSESIERYVKKKTLAFAKNAANINIFKRTAYILFDLKYLLSFKPDVWTDDLRKNFLHGVQILMKLLKEMQGMDSVFRQTGQHMEYEPEWESAFNLHIKLAHVITLVLEWCGTDKIVLVKVYRMVLNALSESEFIVSHSLNTVRELADHSASTLYYDVSSKPVSIHLPLSRFFAGLYLHLEKFDLSFDTITTTTSAKPTPEQIIEPVLCTQTMIAQVHAGLWRRNGYSLLNQLYFYRNVKCRSEMLDRDVVVLQVGASLIESNEFLIHVLNKFNLIVWASAEFDIGDNTISPDGIIEEDSIRHVINMVDEMLELLIVVVGERYVPGIGMVTEEDRIRKEIIQQLCIKPFSHSELSKSLPDAQYDAGFETVIDTVAVFSKPTQSDKKGVYKLNEEYFDDYNMYFYHYTKEEKSKSEEAQRKRHKEKNELVCCPPPKLPQLSASFSMLANLLQCDVMMLIVQTVLKRALDLKARSFSDSHLQKVLHLIGYGLQEQESGFYPFLTFHDHAAKWGILQLVEELVSSVRVEAHRDLLIWTAKKYKELQPRNAENDAMESDENVTEPIADETSTADIERAEKEERARLAADRRAKILAQMASAQKNFISTNAELFENASMTRFERHDSMEWQDLSLSHDDENQLSSIGCMGPNRKPLFLDDQVFTCILCSEESVVNRTGSCMVYSCFIQKSNIFALPDDPSESPHIGTCGHVMHAICWKDYFDNEVLKESRRPNRNRSNNSFLNDKKEFSCPLCRCLSNAVIPIIPALPKFAPPQQQQPPMIPRQFIDDANTACGSASFLDMTGCPSNSSKSHMADNCAQDSIRFEKWIKVMRKYNAALQEVRDLTELTDSTSDIVSKFPSPKPIIETFFDNVDEWKCISQAQERLTLSAELQVFLDDFIRAVRRVAPFPFTTEESEPFFATWIGCAYTISALEMNLRATAKPLNGQMSIRYTSCLSGLIRVSGTLVSCITDDVAAQLMSHFRSMLDTVFNNAGLSVIEWDVFKMLVSLVFITPCVFYAKTRECSIPNGSLMEYYLLKMMFAVNIAKILVLRKSNDSSMDIDDNDDDNDNDDEKYNLPTTSTEHEQQSSKLVDFYLKYNTKPEQQIQLSLSTKKWKLLKKSLETEIRDQSQTFLRCSCLLFRFMTDVELPDEFSDLNGDTFEAMCAYLGLNSDIETYFNNASLHELMIDLVMHKNIQQYKTTNSEQNCIGVIARCVPAVKRFVDLPDDYSDLINSVSTFTCRNNDRDDSRNPTMCLVCGDILCSMTYCCQKELDKNMVGACTYHANKCGAGAGIFLRIRECEIVLLGLNKGSFISAPYLDEYGETDQGLRRGNPLHLCPERLSKLHLMWLGHGLLEDIARSIEGSNNVIGTPWHHL